jgi:hypothetical protein
MIPAPAAAVAQAPATGKAGDEKRLLDIPEEETDSDQRPMVSVQTKFT